MVKLPARFNPSKLSQETSEFSLDVAVAQFNRLCGGLASRDGTVRASMRFRVDTDQRISVEGQFDAQLMLQCQRCLEVYNMPIATEFSLTFVANEAMIDELPDDLDPVLLDEQGQIHVVDLLEDELILHMPLAPHHDQMSDCIANGYVNEPYEFDEELTSQTQTAESQHRNNPFQNLKNLTKPD